MTGNLKLFIPPEEINIIVSRLAKDLRADYASKNPVLIGVLKGASVFLSDLIRAMKMPLEIDFLQTSSYGERDTPSSRVTIIKDITTEVKGKDVIIVEGIIDRGLTALTLAEHIGTKGPASINLCTLLLRDGRAQGVQVAYAGVRIDEGFVVGYGMDYHEHYRNLPGIYLLNPNI